MERHAHYRPTRQADISRRSEPEDRYAGDDEWKWYRRLGYTTAGVIWLELFLAYTILQKTEKLAEHTGIGVAGVMAIIAIEAAVKSHALRERMVNEIVNEKYQDKTGGELKDTVPLSLSKPHKDIMMYNFYRDN